MTLIYVATSGSDSTGTGTAGKPYATIHKASQVAVAGDIVEVMDGTYGPVDMLRCTSGAPGSPITYRAASKWGARIVSADTTPGWTIGDQGLSGPAWIDVVGFEITAPGSHFGITTDGDHINVRGCHVHHVNNSSGVAGAGINLEGYYGSYYSRGYIGANNRATGNVVHAIGSPGNNLCHPIYSDCPNSTIDNNIIYDTGGYGIHCYHASNNPVIVNNLLFNIPSNAAILTGGGPEAPTTQAFVGNNIIIDCARGIAEVDPVTGGAVIQYRNNRFWNVGVEYDTYTRPAARSGDSTGDPGLVNYQIDGSGEYHLATGSPCIGAGTTSHLPTIDLDGATRTAADIGPYAYAGGGGVVGGTGGGAGSTGADTAHVSATTNGPVVTVSWSVASTYTPPGHPIYSFNRVEWSLGPRSSYAAAGAASASALIGYDTDWTAVVTAIYQRVGHPDYPLTETISGTTPARVAAVTTGVIRWTLHDEEGGPGAPADWTFPVNPNTMAAPETPESISNEPVSFDGSNRDLLQPVAPQNWTFGGLLYSLADLDTLEAWLEWGRPAHVTDHFRRTWRIQIQDLNFVRAATPKHPHRHTYTVTALMIGRLA